MPRTVDWRQWTVCRTCACNLNRIALSIMCSYWTCQTIQTAISQVLFSGCPRWILWQQNNCWMRQKLHQKDSGHCSVFIDWGLGRLKIKNPTNSLSVDADKWTTISYISWGENGWDTAICWPLSSIILKMVTNGELRQLLVLLKNPRNAFVPTIDNNSSRTMPL